MSESSLPAVQAVFADENDTVCVQAAEALTPVHALAFKRFLRALPDVHQVEVLPDTNNRQFRLTPVVAGTDVQLRMELKKLLRPAMVVSVGLFMHPLPATGEHEVICYCVDFFEPLEPEEGGQLQQNLIDVVQEWTGDVTVLHRRPRFMIFSVVLNKKLKAVSECLELAKMHYSALRPPVGNFSVDGLLRAMTGQYE